MKFRHIAASLLLLFISVTAFAQRTSVPVIDFAGIPVVSLGATPLTNDQVKRAILAAALNLNWDTTVQTDGAILASTTKDLHHEIAVKLTYDAKQYSVTYVSSKDLHYLKTLPFSAQVGSSAKMYADAEQDQKDKFAANPETPYAVRTEAVIHPAYEAWVRELIHAVRRHIQAIGT